MPSPLQKEFDYYLANKPDLVAKYNGKVIVIKDRKIIGVYESEIEAVTETQRAHALGTFLVQRVQAGDAATTQTFHSRVAFASAR